MLLIRRSSCATTDQSAVAPLVKCCSMTQQLQSAYVFLDVADPLVAWMVYRAELVSAPQVHEQALSVFTARRLHSKAAYERECAIDLVRRERFPGAVSRLTGFYAFPDKDSACAAMSWNVPSFRDELLAEVAIDPGSSVARYDAEWITKHFWSSDPRWIANYFEGEPTGDPIWELLVNGRAIIYGTDIRERAYETVKMTWPASLALLELARVGVELRSDLGLLTAMLVVDDTRLAVRHAMNFADATNTEFLERFAAFDGPKNTNDLTPTSDLIQPDLRDRDFVLC